MKIENSSGFQLDTSLLKGSTNARQHGDGADSTTVTRANDSNAIQYGGGRNLLESNLVDRNAEKSRYISGIMTSFRVQNDFRNKMSGVMGFYQAELTAASTYAERTLIGQKTAAAMGEAVNSEVTNQETERLKKERQESEKELDQKLEEKAEQKLEDHAAELDNNAAASNAEAVSAAYRKTAETTGEAPTSGARNNEQATAEPAEYAAAETADVPPHTATADTAVRAPQPTSSDQSMTHVDIVV